MLYTQDNLLNVNLRSMNKEKIANKIIRKLKKHKWISLILMSLVILSSINAIMIYNFIKILQNI